MDILQDSNNYFNNFVNKNEIILDQHFENIKYNYKILEESDNKDYFPYFNVFEKYYKYKNDVNIIYYILIIYYIEKELLLNFIRFYNSKIIKYKLLPSNKIKPYNEISKYNKIELLKYLKNIINYDVKLFYFLIYTMQYYL